MQVSGYVRSAETAGKLPTKDAVVEYSFSFGGKNYRGSTLTDADGFYSLTILVRVVFKSIQCVAFDTCVILCAGTRSDRHTVGDCQCAQDDSV